jgi:hypothetical protein
MCSDSSYALRFDHPDWIAMQTRACRTFAEHNSLGLPESYVNEMTSALRSNAAAQIVSVVSQDDRHRPYPRLCSANLLRLASRP